MDNKKLITGRLCLRRISTDDAAAMYELAKDPEVGPPAGWKPHESIEESTDIINSIFLTGDSFAVTDRETGVFMGVIAFENDRYRPHANSRELGYWLGRRYWGYGFMTEAARAVIDYGFDVKGFDQIGICTSETNKRSQSVIKKCGFIYEGTIRRTYRIYDGSLRDSRVYSMTKAEWEARRA